MKKTLSQWLELAKGAKSAWLAAKREENADGMKVAALLNRYRQIQDVIESLDEGTPDDTEIEIKGFTDGDDTGIVDFEQVKQFLTAEIEAKIKAALPTQVKEQLKTEDVQATVAEQFKKLNLPQGNLPTQEQIKSLVEIAMTKTLETIRLPSRFRGAGQSDDLGGKDGRDASRIELGDYSLRKGNLPLHMKQLCNVLMKKNINEGIDQSDIDRGSAMGEKMFLDYHTSVGAKALTTAGTGTGAEWLPRDLSSELYRRLYLASVLAQLMAAREIQMPTNPYDLPLALTRPKFWQNRVENTDPKASDIGTGLFTLTAKKLMALVQYSYESNEDSIIPVLPIVQTLLGEAAAASLEDAIINGDTATTHQDSDVTDANDWRKTWNGFRKLALAVASLKSDFSTGGIVRGNLIALKKALGKWSRKPNDLAWIVGTQAENDFLNLDDVAEYRMSGTTPTTLTGTINQFLGIPIVVSEWNREDLNASGVYDGATTTKGSVLLVNLSQFLMGSRREFMVEVERNIKSQTNDIVASFRKAFIPQEAPSATIKTCAIAYNYTA
jgi:HK97 family phage major capsid protein